ncbi:glycoside hydrolase family 73 protein [Companilactobacillus nodensis]|uniref:Mannosyl-glycoprotein endo-beta-N-acetylglucosamidase-like domain-containing protein n=1 Tax=Companilactobacillus nodensis DSM 19682 = JCM 14932 = NBRC 107160 TaxID=1423775 RepID=A0A0R1K7U2_9LACO|nr:glycoside hydrolase family 73 protein [Companilactobacillus nodensis]KRK79352.1 hypothetical protein FD03_GL001718 [Companilactobacillus nodensis DSM 19682 = JCM 14932 = NBRC 107160]
MNKKVLLTSVAVLNTLAAVAAPTVASAATDTTSVPDSTEQVSNTTQDNKDTNVIAGSDVSKVDTTVAHSAAVQTQPSTKAVVQATSSGVTYAQQQAFLAEAVPMAQQAAAKYNVYTSVMLAQAILESAWGTSTLATQGHNLFGIKGDYNGAYVSMPTSEWSASQGWYTIYANFRQYPSYYESFLDNGNKLRNGVSWNSSYYSGTWKENAASYKDATAWLQGRYATAPNYASSLNSLIATYNLTQYDGTAETNSGADNDATTGTVRAKTSPYTRIYNNEGKVVTNRALMTNTDWYYNRTKTDSNGTVWYHVATTEWVSANDISVL